MPQPELSPERIKGQFKRQNTRFTKTTFLGALTGFRGNMQTGNLDMTISVGPGEKDRALSVTDAPGELLLVTVERVSAKGRKRVRPESTTDK